MDEEISTILQELRLLDDDQCQLNEKRIPLLRKLNHMQSTTRVLAPEILSLVFQHTRLSVCLYPESRTCNPPGWYSHRFFPIILGHVSHHWRQVAWSTPQLWTTISLDMRQKTKQETFAALLELYMTNVGNLPVSLDLDIAPSQGPLDTISDVLFRKEYSRNIQFLQLSNMPSGWISSFSNDFSRLKHFSLNGEYQQVLGELLLTDIPRLSRVTLRNIGTTVKLHWSTITILELHSVIIETCVELLTNCPNLVKFRSLSPRTTRQNRDDPSPETGRQLVFCDLEDFSWTHIPGPRLLALLGHVRFPTIRSLSWDQITMKPGQCFPYIRALLSDLPTSLTAIKFHHLSEWPQSMVQYVFSHIYSVQEMTLKYCHKETTRKFLTNLNWTSHSHYLPGLKTLHINYCYGVYSETCDSDPDTRLRNHDLQLILEALAGRFNSGVCSSFRLELHNTSIIWEPSIKKTLQHLVKEGFDLEILVDHKRMAWLYVDSD